MHASNRCPRADRTSTDLCEDVEVVDPEEDLPLKTRKKRSEFDRIPNVQRPSDEIRLDEERARSPIRIHQL